MDELGCNDPNKTPSNKIMRTLIMPTIATPPEDEGPAVPHAVQKALIAFGVLGICILAYLGYKIYKKGCVCGKLALELEEFQILLITKHKEGMSV